jgi:hypothetical protein
MELLNTVLWSISDCYRGLIRSDYFSFLVWEVIWHECQ